jgi:hypothetical protein
MLAALSGEGADSGYLADLGGDVDEAGPGAGPGAAVLDRVPPRRDLLVRLV